MPQIFGMLLLAAVLMVASYFLMPKPKTPAQRETDLDITGSAEGTE